MLNRVPTAISRAARIVTLRHPNAMDCTIYRKRLNRTAPPDETMGEIANVGGIGVLDGEDEADFDYEVVGDARIVFAEPWQDDGANWNDVDSGVIYDKAPKLAMIEFVSETDGYIRKPDIVSVEPGGGIVLVYEVLGENGNVAIPPYTRRYILAARSDQNVGIG